MAGQKAARLEFTWPPNNFGRPTAYLFVAAGAFVEGGVVSLLLLQPVRNMPLSTQASIMRESFNFIRR